MINNFLTYSHGKKEHKVHEELSIKPPQLAAFLDLLEIDLSAPAYENQQKKIVDLLISEIPDCNSTDAEVFNYPTSINVIQGQAIEADETKRTVTSSEFLKEIIRKELVFSSWLQKKLGSEHY